MIPIQGDGSATVKRYGSDKPFSKFARVIEFQSTADSKYNGLTVELNKRFSHNWQAKLAYTLSKVTDNKPDATAVVPQTSDDAKYASDPQDFGADYAPGDNDVRHRLVLSGVWNLDYAGATQNPAPAVPHFRLDALGRHLLPDRPAVLADDQRRPEQRRQQPQ